MSRPHFRPTLTLSAVVLVACGGDGTEGSSRATAPLEPSARDSAGVTILTHGPEAFARAPRIALDTTPVAEIHGSAEDEAADISTINPLLFLSDGRLVGRDRQRQAVVIFDADGGDRQEFGRQGAGPGEYGFISTIIRLSDTLLLVQDGRNARLSLFDPRTGPVLEWPLSEAMGAGGNTVVGRVGDQVLMWGMNFQSGGQRLEMAAAGAKGVLFDPAANAARRVFTTGPDEQPEDGGRVLSIGGGAVAVRAISIQPLQAFPTVIAWNDRFVLADGNHLQFELRDTSGVVTSLLRFDQPRVAVTDAVWQAYVDEMIARMIGASGGGADVTMAMGGGQPDTAEVRRRMLDQEHADSLPAYQRLHVTANSTLWIVDHDVPGRDGWAATAISPDGRLLGRLIGLSGDPPVAFGNDRVAFRSEDDLGIATIAVHRLRMP